MAKMKVHELAKEVDRKSKELIDFLQAKGYEVKVAQSSIEDEAIALVRKEFGSSGQEKAPEKESKPAEEKAGKAEPAAKKAEAPAAESTRKEEKAETPKKKRIIFVSNPHNSKMAGRPSQGQSAGGGQPNRGNNRSMSNGSRPVQPQNAPHKIVRPTQKPIPVTAERLRNRREWAVQGKIADLRIRAGRIITAVRLIAKAAALPSLAAGAVEIVNALREEMAGRTIDFGKITVRRTLSLRRPVRIRPITGTRKSAGQTKTGINAPRRIIFMRRMKRQ